MISPGGTPLAIGTYKSTYFLTILRPSHYLHLTPSSKSSPIPEHLSQFFSIWVYIPGPIWTNWMVAPSPLQSGHFFTFSPPFPSQMVQRRALSWWRLTTPPLYIFSNGTSTTLFVGCIWGLYFCLFLLFICPPNMLPIISASVNCYNFVYQVKRHHTIFFYLNRRALKMPVWPVRTKLR